MAAPRRDMRHASAEEEASAPLVVHDLDIRRSLAMKLTVVARQLWTNFNQLVDESGLTRAQWTLIATVSRHPGATQRVIATLLQVTEVTAGRLIDRLCSDGYLERQPNPDDRRSYRVFLTPKAQPVLDKLGDLATTHASEVFAGFTDEQLKTYEALLDSTTRNIEQNRNR